MEMRDVLRVAVGTIILLVLIMIFVKMFSVPKCDGMANETVTKLAYEIEKVDKGECFLVDDPNVRCPCNDPDRCYAAVPIKLCQSNLKFGKFAGVVSNAIAGGSPEYQIYYNSPPGEDAPWLAPWTETYPWSGGAASGIYLYAAIRYLPIVAKYAGIGIWKAGGKAAGTLSGRLLRSNFRVLKWLGRKMQNYALRVAESERAAKMLKVASKAKSLGVEDDVYRIEKVADETGYSIDTLADEIARGNDVTGEVENALRLSGVSDEAAKKGAKRVVKFLKSVSKMKLGEDSASILESIEYMDNQLKFFADGKAVLVSADGVPIRDYKGRYVIAPEYRKMFRGYMRLLSDDEANLYKSIFYAPYRRSPFTWRYRIWKYAASTKFGKFLSFTSRTARKIRGKIFGHGIKDGTVLSKQSSKELITDIRLSLLRKKLSDKEFLIRAYDNPILRQRLEDVAGGHILYRDPYSEINFYRLLNEQEEFVKANNWNLVISGDNDLSPLIKFDEYPEYVQNFERYKRVGADEFFESNDEIYTKWIRNDLEEQLSTWKKIGMVSDEEYDNFLKEIDEIAKNARKNNEESWKAIRNYMKSDDFKYKNFIKWENTRANVISKFNRERNVILTSREYAKVSIYNPATNSFEPKVYKPIYNELKVDAYITRVTLRPSRMSERLLLGDFISETPKSTVSPEPLFYRTRKTRLLWFDLGKSYNPLWPGSNMVTREIEESLPYAGNSLILTKGGTESVIIPLNITRPVRFPRGSPGYLPIGIQTTLWRAFPPPENPRFYAVSPCFGIAKIWKKGGTIWVKIEKCDAENGGKKCSNYCYADEKYVWGSWQADATVWGMFIAGEGVGWTTYIGINSACAAAGAPCPKAAGTAAKYAGIGALYTAFYAVTDKSDWGYWDYYKIADACDDIDMTFGFVGWYKTRKLVKAGSEVGSIASTKLGGKLAATRLGKALSSSLGQKVVKGAVADICMGFYIYGEQELAWPGRGEKISLPEKSINDATLQCIAEHG